MPPENQNQFQNPELSSPKKKNTVTRVVFLVIVLLITILVIFYVLLSAVKLVPEESGVTDQIKEVTNQASEIPENTVPEGWQTYRNEELGFQFKYPSDWGACNVPQQLPYPNLHGICTQPANLMGVTFCEGVYILVDTDNSLLEVYESNKKSTDAKFTESDIKIGDTDAKKLVKDIGGVNHYIFLEKDNKVFQISYFGASTESVNANENIVYTLEFFTPKEDYTGVKPAECLSPKSRG